MIEKITESKNRSQIKETECRRSVGQEQAHVDGAVVMFVKNSATHASVALEVPSQTSTEQLLAIALAKFGLPSSQPASLTHQGKPIQLGQGSQSKAGLAPLATLTLELARLPGGS